MYTTYLYFHGFFFVYFLPSCYYSLPPLYIMTVNCKRRLVFSLNATDRSRRIWMSYGIYVMMRNKEKEKKNKKERGRRINMQIRNSSESREDRLHSRRRWIVEREEHTHTLMTKESAGGSHLSALLLLNVNIFLFFFFMKRMKQGF